LLYIGGLICEHIPYYCDNPIFSLGSNRFTIQDKIKYAPAPLGLFIWRFDNMKTVFQIIAVYAFIALCCVDWPAVLFGL
jgi:hypothetical protein